MTSNNNNNNNNGGEKYNPFRDNIEDSPWHEETPLNTNNTGHSPFNPFTQPIDTTINHYSPSDVQTNDLIDLQPGIPQSPAQVASSSSTRQQHHEHIQPNLNNMTSGVSSAHFNNERRGKNK